MHICVYCGQACYCGMEDHENPQPIDCDHQCDDDLDDQDCYSDYDGDGRRVGSQSSDEGGMT
jgi:hypothetical protein